MRALLILPMLLATERALGQGANDDPCGAIEL